MVATLLDAASWLLLVAGALLAVAGAVGMLRMPDFYTRMHAASVSETGGMMLIVGGLLLQAPDPAVALRLVLIAVFLLLTNPTAAHALAYSAMSDGVEPELRAGRGRRP